MLLKLLSPKLLFNSRHWRIYRAYFKPWSLQYILELFLKRHGQHVKIPDVSSVLSASLSWAGKESVNRTPLGKWNLDWNVSHYFVPERKVFPSWGRKLEIQRFLKEDTFWEESAVKGWKGACLWPQTYMDWTFLWSSHLTLTLGGRWYHP